MIRGILASIAFLLSIAAFAQEQIITTPVDSSSIQAEQDTVLIESYSKRFNPRKALYYSAIVPGMGQIYNKKYWKLPIVYGGFLGGVYMINFYQQGYLKYKGELFDLLNDNTQTTSPSGLNQDQLRTVINKAGRERDYWSILTGLWYMLQIVDAHVDAHLKEFDLNPQLKVKLEPKIESDQMVGRTSGLSIKLKF
jgi:Family of unknown function (DUF5683)